MRSPFFGYPTNEAAHPVEQPPTRVDVAYRGPPIIGGAESAANTGGYWANRTSAITELPRSICYSTTASSGLVSRGGAWPVSSSYF